MSRNILGALFLVALVTGCVNTSSVERESADPVEEGPVWVCQTREDAFGAVTASCSISADFVEGALVLMSYGMTCTRETPDEQGFVISRFSARDAAGQLVDFRSKIDVSRDGGEKERLEWRGFEQMLLDDEQFGIDSWDTGSETVHRKILPQTETLLIRATINSEPYYTTTSRFEWGDWSEPISFFEENGCTWR